MSLPMRLWLNLQLVMAVEDLFVPLRLEGSPRERQLIEELRQWSDYAFKVTGRLVAVMTTTPQRIEFIEPAIDSLLNQSRSLDVLYLFVPMTFLRDGSSYEIPEWLGKKISKFQSMFQLRRCVDSGPATHMHQVLKIERSPKTYILQVDDDQIYGHRLLEKLLAATGPLPGRAIGAATQHAYHYLQGAVLEGVHGVLFQRKFFDRWASSYEGFPDTCRLHDDLWFSAHLARKGIQRESLFSRFGSQAQKLGFGTDALFRGGAGTDNRWNFLNCMAALLKAQPNLWDVKERIVMLAPLSTYEPINTIDAKSLLSALSRLKRGERSMGRPGPHGPHALYLFGRVGQERLQRLKERWGSDMDMGHTLVTSNGPWNSTLELVLRDCHSHPGGCSYLEALRFLLSLEDDPMTILVVLAKLPKQKHLHASLKQHLKCLGATHRPQNCRLTDGLSFRRYSASNWKEVGKTIFLPHFSANFGTSDGSMPSIEPRFMDLDSELRSFAAYFKHFQATLRVDPVAQSVITGWLEEPRRAVALLWAPSGGVHALAWPRLLRQLRGMQRVYLHLPGPPGGCRIPGVLAHRHRVSFLCGQDPWMELLKREAYDDTLILLGEAGPRSHFRFRELLQALHLWSGHAVAERAGYDFLPYWPSGFLLKRSFLDVRLLDLEIPQQLVHHLHMKGITWRVLSSHVGQPRQPVQPPQPVPVPAARCVLVVRLPAEEMAELTLRLAAAQSRTPEEVVLVTTSDWSPSPKSDTGLVEVSLEGSLAGAAVITQRRQKVSRHSPSPSSRQLSMSLVQLLHALKEKAGCVVHKKSQSFVLSVVSCGEAVICSPRSILSVAFAREWEPGTILMFGAPERLVNERFVEDNEDCIAGCSTSFDQEKWCGCGQNQAHKGGTLYDMTIRRASGYILHT